MNGRLPGKGRPAPSAAAGRRPPSWLGRATRPPWSSGGGLRAVLVRGAGGTFALKVAAAGLGFVASLLLARLLGAAGYGAYAYAQSWLTLLALTMTGHQRDAAASIGAGAVLNVVLNVALIPGWGLEGAAAATATSMIVWNLLLAVAVRRRLGINASALGRIGRGRAA